MIEGVDMINMLTLLWLCDCLELPLLEKNSANCVKFMALFKIKKEEMNFLIHSAMILRLN